MKEIEKIAQQIEGKLEKLESERERISEQIRTKRQQVSQLESALEKLRAFQKNIR